MKTKESFLLIIIFTTLFLSFQVVKAQLPIDPESGKVKFSGIVELPGVTKDKIYKKAKLWIVSTLKSGDNMVALSGDNTDQLVGSGNIFLDSLRMTKDENSLAKEAYLNFKFIVSYKDNKLKYSIENFILQYKYGQDILPGGPEYVETRLENIRGPVRVLFKKDLENFSKNIAPIYLKRQIDNLIADFISYLKKEENNNW